MNREIDILNELDEIDPNSLILFTTFRFSQTFFEAYIFSKIKKSMPLIIIDYYEYQSNILEYGKSRYAERTYFIDTIKCKNVFHPKLILALNDNEIKIWIGSNNLTPQGYCSNAELVVPIIINIQEKDNLEMIPDLKDFLFNIHSLLLSEQHKDRLKSIYKRLPEYEGDENRSSWILHNIKTPILDQIIEIIGKNVNKIYIISPYFSDNIEFYKSLLIVTKDINIIVQQNTSNLPTDLLENLQPLNFHYFIINIKNERFLHGKLILFETDETNYIFSGSANFTHSALVSCNNIELGVLTSSALKLEDVIGDMGQVKPVNLRNIKSHCEVSENITSTHIEYSIIETKIINSTLIVKLDKPYSEENLKLILGSEYKELPMNVDGNTIEFFLSDRELEMFGRTVPIRIAYEKDGVLEYSDYKLAHNPLYFPERYLLLNSMNINDVNWLLHIFDKLARIPNFGDYIRVLEEVLDNDNVQIFTKENKEQIISNLRNRILSIKPYNQQEQLTNVIERFIKRHQNRVDKAIKDKDADMADQAINSFILTNKLIIWSIDRNYKDIHHLRNVKANMENFLINKNNYLNKILNGDQGYLIKDSRLKYHIAMLTFIIDFMQRDSLEFMPDPRLGYNTVKKVFEKSTVLSLKRIIDLEDNTFYKNDIDKFIKEYGEIYRDISIASSIKFDLNLNELIQKANSHSNAKCKTLNIIN
jgi:hypothetical protein